MLCQEFGSVNVGRRARTLINRDCIAANEFMIHDYFAPDSLYDQEKFKERFHVSRKLFLRIVRHLAD